jgi:hypothetical protein
MGDVSGGSFLPPFDVRARAIKSAEHILQRHQTFALERLQNASLAVSLPIDKSSCASLIALNQKEKSERKKERESLPCIQNLLDKVAKSLTLSAPFISHPML